MDSIEKQFRKIEADIKKKVDGFISFQELFPDSFVKKHSGFSSIGDLFEQGGFKYDTRVDSRAINEGQIDAFICENTDFESWADMKRAADAAYVKRKITL